MALGLYVGGVPDSDVMPVTDARSAFVQPATTDGDPENWEWWNTGSQLTGESPRTVVGKNVTRTGSAGSYSYTAAAVVDSLASRRPGWRRHAGNLYVRGLELTKVWWPYEHRTEATRNRSRNVLEFELPNWWHDVHRILSAAVEGRAWTTMTIAEIDACFAHMETLLAGPIKDASNNVVAPEIIRRWYDVGVSKTGTALNTPNALAHGTGNVGTQYITLTAATPYTDFWAVTNSKLVARTPDYQWLSLAGWTSAGEPADWKPEAPT